MSARSFYMHGLLTKLLRKRGIEDTNQLTEEEKQSFEAWNGILSKETLTVADFKAFMKAQVGLIETKWKDLGLEQAKKAELIPYHAVYKTLITVIDAPKKEKEHLEQYLESLIEKG